ncbi:MAG: AAA family ATPase [Lewinellaceae bacterium]|nr:AAA family ATPase [Saprospiraceae bacterium]MCB9338137.1 AAA family ATPase [Lewinellaceae bacterium]
MADTFKNKIKRLELENFTCFGKVAMDFSSGINVFIGENGTGKTHLLKVLYHFVDRVESENLWDVFKVEKISSLIRNSNFNATGKIYWNNHERYFEIDSRLLDDQYSHIGEWKAQNSNTKIAEPVFLPSQEMISWFKGFISAYENRESYIDETYYRLAKALASLSLKGESLKRQEPLYKELEEAIKGKVIRKGDDFFIEFFDEQKEFQAPIVATGINKLAQLIYLIMNGSLTKDTILFWDEPEANLNPKYILVVAKFLQTLANAGCQIFVATHDYLLPYELSLSKEYADVAEGKVPDMKFFALYKGEDGTKVEEGATMPDLSHDAIHEGLRQHQSREDRLFQKSLNANT